MRLQQFLKEVVNATDLVDATGRSWQWPPDVNVRPNRPDSARPGETALLVVDLAQDRIEEEALLMQRIRLGTVVVVLVEPEPVRLPVGALIDVLVTGGIQALHALPISEDGLGTAIAGLRSAGEMASIAPYLDPRREIPLSPGAAMLRIMAERVVEGVAWRAVEVLAKHDREARQSAEHERDEARVAADAVLKQLDEVRTTCERQVADMEGKVATADAKMRRILASRSYRLARALGAPVRVVRSPFKSR
jgi:hypothetical protein